MRITHGRITLALHELAQRPGFPLLLLHGLGGSTAEWGDVPDVWPGRVFGLDFCGHGQSDPSTGGAYFPELLVGDADAALTQIGPAAVTGAGLGAYVALLLAGTRPDRIPAVLLLPGPGLAGAGAVPDFTRSVAELDAMRHGNGAMMIGLGRDVRPIDYAEPFARAARRVLLLDDTDPRPPWWETVRQLPTVESLTVSLPGALARLAAAATAD